MVAVITFCSHNSVTVSICASVPRVLSKAVSWVLTATASMLLRSLLPTTKPNCTLKAERRVCPTCFAPELDCCRARVLTSV